MDTFTPTRDWLLSFFKPYFSGSILLIVQTCFKMFIYLLNTSIHCLELLEWMVSKRFISLHPVTHGNREILNVESSRVGTLLHEASQCFVLHNLMNGQWLAFLYPKHFTLLNIHFTLPNTCPFIHTFTRWRQCQACKEFSAWTTRHLSRGNRGSNQ